MADIKTQDAVIRNLQTFCESTQRLPIKWKAAHPETDWIRIAEFRIFLAHQYLDVDLEIVWNVATNYLPELKMTVEAIAQEYWNQ